MGCLFGYCGKRSQIILDKMAGILSHRCKRGWEKAGFNYASDCRVEIGRGIPQWSESSQVADAPSMKHALGYSGVIFDAEDNIRKDLNRLRHHEELCRSTGSQPLQEEPFPLLNDPESYLSGLDGAFVCVFACGDHIYLIRDPAGIKVIYWTVHKDRLVFASEIKALFADPSVNRTLRKAALPEYFTFSYIPGERTMMENIFELQPGSMLVYSENGVRIRRYFEFEKQEWHPSTSLPIHQYVQNLRNDLEAGVKSCCKILSSPPGVFLSGGIDSSAVLALTARQYPEICVPTFSVHFGSKYANENDYVSMMIDRYNTDHTWVEIKPSKFMDRMRKIVWLLDDPIGDPITVPNFIMSEMASRKTSVVLNGEGGDPCFGGPKNIPMTMAAIYGPLPGEHPDEWMERNYLVSYKKCFSDLDKILSEDLLRESGGEPSLINVVTPFFNTRQPENFLNKLMAANIRLKGANLILVKVDKMTSANGLLAMPPLFLKQIILSSIQCPPELKLMGNIEKGILKKAVEDIVPSPIVQRPKSGMMVPVRFWFQGEMRRYARRILSKKNLNHTGLFKTDYVKKLLDYDRTQTHGARHGLKLWMLITFMLWYEQFISRD